MKNICKQMVFCTLLASAAFIGSAPAHAQDIQMLPPTPFGSTSACAATDSVLVYSGNSNGQSGINCVTGFTSGPTGAVGIGNPNAATVGNNMLAVNGAANVTTTVTVNGATLDSSGVTAAENLASAVCATGNVLTRDSAGTISCTALTQTATGTPTSIPTPLTCDSTHMLQFAGGAWACVPLPSAGTTIPPGTIAGYCQVGVAEQGATGISNLVYPAIAGSPCDCAAGWSPIVMGGFDPYEYYSCISNSPVTIGNNPVTLPVCSVGQTLVANGSGGFACSAPPSAPSGGAACAVANNGPDSPSSGGNGIGGSITITYAVNAAAGTYNFLESVPPLQSGQTTYAHSEIVWIQGIDGQGDQLEVQCVNGTWNQIGAVMVGSQ